MSRKSRVSIRPVPENINGTNGNDLITITEGLLNALSVNINGTTTNVTLAAGRELHVYALNGHDIVNVIGLTRPTYVDGGNGDDLIQGLQVTNTAATLWLTGGAGLDLLRGGAGDDILDGGIGNDTIYAGDGHDTLRGGDGNDILLGQAGNDNLQGDAGNDQISGGGGTDTINGGAGTDQGVTPAAGSPPMVSIETVLATDTALLAAATAAKQAWLTNFLTVIDADPDDFLDRNEISILINTAS